MKVLIAILILYLALPKPEINVQEKPDMVDTMYHIARQGGRLPDSLVNKYTSVDSALAQSRNTYHWYAGREGNIIYDSIRLMVIEASNITCKEKYLVTFTPQGKQAGILLVGYWCNMDAYISEYVLTDYKWVSGNTISVEDSEIIRNRDGSATKSSFNRTYRIQPNGVIDVL